MKTPFNLCENEATLLGRYIVEDDCEIEDGPGNIYVYCHDDN